MLQNSPTSATSITVSSKSSMFSPLKALICQRMQSSMSHYDNPADGIKTFDLSNVKIEQ